MKRDNTEQHIKTLIALTALALTSLVLNAAARTFWENILGTTFWGHNTVFYDAWRIPDGWHGQPASMMAGARLGGLGPEGVQAGGCTAGEGGGDADALRGSAMNASTQPALGDIMAGKRADLLAVDQRRRLLISRDVIELSERSTSVAGRRPSGKSRLRALASGQVHPLPLRGERFVFRPLEFVRESA
ncbi:MAG TPA: hypothetical protein VMY42_06160 [Thermoguttaceae bacterium]|nr:hypothetical protein [Thermoguttaceae bacterium]